MVNNVSEGSLSFRISGRCSFDIVEVLVVKISMKNAGLILRNPAKDVDVDTRLIVSFIETCINIKNTSCSLISLRFKIAHIFVKLDTLSLAASLKMSVEKHSIGLVNHNLLPLCSIELSEATLGH